MSFRISGKSKRQLIATGNQLRTAEASLDLTNSLVSGGVTIASTNATGTTFTVDDATTTGLRVVGGAGNDTLLAQGFAFTEGQRAAIFAQGSVDTITDTSGTYTAPNRIPNGITLSASSIDENNDAAALVATLTAVDPDSAVSGNAGPFTFALVSGTGDTNNAEFSIVGNELRINGSADFETQSSYSIRLRVTDNGGASFETVKTITINNVNEGHTGTVAITGTATENQTLTADTSGLADADGLGTFSYQWQRDGANIGGATNATYTLGDADVGAAIRVVVSYTDGQGFAETSTSAPTSAVGAVNDPHTGTVAITGAATENQTLTADTSGLADADGLGTFSYQWQRDGANIGGATNATYTLGDADVGAAIRVVVSYTDGQGFAETETSTATSAVTAINDPHTGTVAITGTATENQTLTADTSGLADADGLGTFSYQWQRDGANIGGATNATYTLGDADVGAAIRVDVSYTDGQGFAETSTSAPTSAVGAVNDPHTGTVAITGAATENQTLTADTSGLADADGLGAFSYQWKRNGVDIPTAVAASYVLGAVDTGSQIRVVVSYTDDQGFAETSTSAATPPVTSGECSSGPPRSLLHDSAGVPALRHGRRHAHDNRPRRRRYGRLHAPRQRGRAVHYRRQ